MKNKGVITGLAVMVIFVLGVEGGEPRRPGNWAYLHDAQQYNNYGSAYSWYGTDGERDPDLGHRSCFHTGKNDYGTLWWYVDLGLKREIKYVLITNRNDAEYRLRYIKLLISDTMKNPNEYELFNNVTLCADISPDGTNYPGRSKVTTYECPEVIEGRYLMLHKSFGKDYMNLCEIEVYSQDTFLNSALHRPSKLSSYIGNRVNAGRINDGQTYPFWSGYSWGTNEYLAPNIRHWYMVDLGKMYTIRYAILVPVKDYGHILKLFKFHTSKQFDPADWSKNHFSHCYARNSAFLKSGTPDALYANCKYGTTGRYFVVEKNHGSYLLITELEVYTSQIDTNLALGRSAVNSDEAKGGYDFSFSSDKTSPRVVDGDNTHKFSAGSCVALSGKTPLEWWTVMLDAIYKIRYLVITNRADYGHCTGPMGVANDRKKVPDGNLRGQSYRRGFSNKWARLWYEMDGWCGGRSTAYFEVHFGKFVYLTGVTIQAARYYFMYAYNVLYYTTGWKDLKHTRPPYSKIRFVGPYSGSTHRTQWFPHGIVAKAIRIQPIWVYYYSCLKMEVHGCWDYHADMDKFKIQVSKTFDPKNYNSVPKSLCYEHKEGPMHMGHLQPLHCRPQPVGQYVTIEKDASKAGALSLCEVEVYGDPYDGNLAYLQPAMQKTTYWDRVAGRAVDANTNPVVAKKGCSQTLSAKYDILWWAVDLGQVQDIGRVMIHGEAKCCEKCLSSFQILVTDNFDKKNFLKNTFGTCHENTVPFKSAEARTINCKDGTRGRYVVIKAPGKHPLTLCEVKIFSKGQIDVNLALGKPADQSSDDSPVTGLAKAATDGNRDSNFNHGSCSYTCPGGGMAWWSVDLQKVYRVRRIAIFNRGDCCGNNLREFSVMVSETFVPGKMSTVAHIRCHYQKKGLSDGEVKEVFCGKQAVGRYVTIEKNSRVSLPLSLCEVEVYGHIHRENLALKKPASINKGYLDRFGIQTAIRANDGNASPYFKHSSCAETVVENMQSWWAVDLLKDYLIDTVYITNRVDANAHHLRSYAVMVSREFYFKEFDKLPYRFCRDMHKAKALIQSTVEIFCVTPVNGRYVIIKKDGSKHEKLTLCEVEVFGKNATAPANLALNKPTEQSSENSMYSRTSERATDGNRKAKMAEGSCSETSGVQDTEWWTVDLKASYNIGEVSIATRADCCTNKRMNLTVLVSDQFVAADLNQLFPGAYKVITTTGPTTATTTTNPPTPEGTTTNTTNPPVTTNPPTTTIDPRVKYAICAKYDATPPLGLILDLNCTARGRHVTIIKSGAKMNPLALCEVEIYSAGRGGGGWTTQHPGGGTGTGTLSGGTSGTGTGGTNPGTGTGGATGQPIWTTTTTTTTGGPTKPSTIDPASEAAANAKVAISATTGVIMASGTALALGLALWKYKSFFSMPKVGPSTPDPPLIEPPADGEQLE